MNRRVNVECARVIEFVVLAYRDRPRLQILGSRLRKKSPDQLFFQHLTALTTKSILHLSARDAKHGKENSLQSKMLRDD